MMSEQRPDPDALLRAVQNSGEERVRGRLKIFFGATAGVGKTYAMLQEAQTQRETGRDVLAGVIETHGRSETAAMLAGLPQLPRLELAHRGVSLPEFDLDAALERRPELILVDELAHTNAPGSRHSKRWQDVEELLAAGIDVYSTVNVQHLESLNDVVAQITGVTVRETIPDAILEQAEEVELIDISPEELLNRLREGKVYLPEQAERALASFFTRANLSALRELALRRTAQQVDTQMQAERILTRAQGTWPATERLIVCIGPGPLGIDMVRSAKRMAGEMHAQWEAVYVETASGRELPPRAQARIEEALRLAESLGGEAVTLPGERVVDTLVAYARERNASKILVGKPTHPAWRDRIRGSLLEALIRQSGDIDVYVVRAQATAGTARSSAPLAHAHSAWQDYLFAVLIVGGFTLGAKFLHPHLQLANLIMIYLLAVVTVALRSGRGPASLAAVLAVAAFDFCFVPPYLTFAVQDIEYVITFAVMLLVSLIIANLTFRLKQQALSAVQRERRTSSLYRLSRELASAGGVNEVLDIGEQRLAELFPAQAALILRGRGEKEIEIAPRHYELFSKPRNEAAVMQWVLENGKAAGLGTTTLPGSEAFYQPLSAGRGNLGVLALKPLQAEAGFLQQPEQRHLLDALASLISIACERELNEQSEQDARLQAERERLRSTLLSSISHDLRTPLAGISGSAETLLALGGTAEAERSGLLQGIKSESERLSLLLENILDLTRIESGALKLKLEAQPLEEVVGAALNSLERRLEGRELSLQLPDDLPMVRIDAVLIERVLVNLLDNALKYTPAGSPLEVMAIAKGKWVEVAVCDRGPGLPDGDLAALFDTFSRPPGALGPADGMRGTGMGLSICKSLVEAHGGVISAQAREGGGSVFSFSLPAEDSPAASSGISKGLH